MAVGTGEPCWGVWSCEPRDVTAIENGAATTVELRNVETQGTVEIPAVFDPGAAPLPDRLHCSFTLRASSPKLLEKTVRVTGRATLPLRG